MTEPVWLVLVSYGLSLSPECVRMCPIVWLGIVDPVAISFSLAKFTAQLHLFGQSIPKRNSLLIPGKLSLNWSIAIGCWSKRQFYIHPASSSWMCVQAPGLKDLSLPGGRPPWAGWATLQCRVPLVLFLSQSNSLMFSVFPELYNYQCNCRTFYNSTKKYYSQIGHGGTQLQSQRCRGRAGRLWVQG
jgi:hypothetical protein